MIVNTIDISQQSLNKVLFVRVCGLLRAVPWWFWLGYVTLV